MSKIPKTYLRKISKVITVIFFLVASMSMAGIGDVQAAGNTYYVSKTGNDHTGTGTQANPWETIQKAADTMWAGDTCIIRAGTYRETVIPARSGTSGNPITFRAAAGENVVVSGLDPVISDWTLHSGNIYKAPASMTLGDNDQVFVDGEPMIWARWPNSGGTDWLMNPTLATCDSGTTGSKIVDSAMQNIDWTGGKVWHTSKAKSGWADWETTITSYANRSITFTAPVYPGWDVCKPSQGTNYYLSGKLAALNSEKEWFFEASTGLLYLYKPGGGDPSGNTVEYKSRTWGFDLSGKSYIEIQDLNLFGNSINTSDTTTHCTIDSITAKYIWHTTTAYANHTSLVTDPYSGIILTGSYNEIKNSEIAYSDGCGIVLGGSWNRIVNNNIHDCNYKGVYAANIYLIGERHLVSHNTITRSGRSLISGNLGFLDCVVQYNDMSLPMYQTKDGGAFYFSWSNGGNTEIRYNKIHNEGGYIGLYIDSNTHGILSHHNIIYNCANAAINLGNPNEYNSHINNSTFNDGEIRKGTAIPKHANNYFGTKIINNIAQNGIYTGTNSTFLTNHGTSSPLPGYTNPGAQNFNLTSSAQAKDSGTVVPGITDGYLGAKPDKGALEYGGTEWTAGYMAGANPDPTYSLSNYIYKNHVINPGFDTGNMNSWSKTGTQTAVLAYDPNQEGWNSVNAAQNTGPYSCQLGSGVNGIEQIITGLSPNTIYTVSVWVRVLTGESAQFGVKSHGGADVSVTQGPANYVQKTLTFTTGSGNTSATIYLNKTSSGSNPVYVDDFGMQYTGEADPNLALNKTAAVSNYYQNNPTRNGAKAVDGNMTTRWATDDGISSAWLEIDFGAPATFNTTILKECTDYGQRINTYEIKYWNGSSWVDAYSGGVPAAVQTDTFSPVISDKVRLNISSVTGTKGPTVWEFEVYNNP